MEGRGGSDMKLLAVTVLTSLDEADIYDMGHYCTIRELVARRVKQAIETGMDGVVGKPIDLDLLDSVVTKALLARRKGRPRTSSVPPLSKELVAKTLQKEYFERRARKSDRMASSSPIGSPGADTISRRSSFPLSLEELSLMQESAILSASAKEDPNDDDEIFVNLDEQLTKSLTLDDLCKTAIEEEIPYYILQKITDG